MTERKDELYGAIFKEMAETEGKKLLREEKSWRKRVPEAVDAAAMAAILGMPFDPPAKTPEKLTIKAPKAAGLSAAAVTAVSLAAAAAIGVGAYAGVPAVRDSVNGAFSSFGSVIAGKAVKSVEPGVIEIPSPGDEFVITDEVRSDRIAYKWFTSEDSEVLVEVAYNMLLSSGEQENAEKVNIGGVEGYYYRSDDKELLTMKKDEVYIRIAYFNSDRAELERYASELIRQNF